MMRKDTVNRGYTRRLLLIYFIQDYQLSVRKGAAGILSQRN